MKKVSLTILALTCAFSVHAGTITGGGAFVDVQSTEVGTTPDFISYTEDVLLTVSGPLSSGYFEPIAYVVNSRFAFESSIGQIDVACGLPNCGYLQTTYTGLNIIHWSQANGAIPFVANVPIALTITLRASNCCYDGLQSEANLNGFTLYDIASHQPVAGGVFTLAPISQAPEPRTLWMTIPLFAFGLQIMRRRGVQQSCGNKA